MEFLFDDAVDCADGAFSGTKRAAFARVRDFVTQQIFANACGASLVDNVRHVLVAEITKRREYGVGRGLTESAKAVCLYVVAKFFHLVKVLQRCFARRDFFKIFQKSSVTDTARRAFSAAFVDGGL